MSDVEATEQDDTHLSLLEHLNELRKRLVWAALALMIATVFSFLFAQAILDFLLTPYSASIGGEATLQTLKPTEGLETYFKVALLSGAIIAMPVILVQFWSFISPGTTAQERRYIYIFIPSALFLFLLGIAFAWFILAPAAIFFLANFMTDIFKTEWTGQEYISFVTRLVFWMGVSFELPIIAYFVARIGVITSQNLRDQWRVAIVAVAVIAAIITPSIDPVTMLLTMAPLLVLYLLSIGLARIGQRQYERSVAI
ncbi:MAG: twin-arginine translocase subunit TatC [Anaerolineaceae bacterium]|jgi:sec-independent protein translocase protein TatC|nr:twin-arginine translocase subunit TatC [Chloroflexota bacterium]UCC54866.1 MAG: twin-arginine translocase subunit TatC [Anaerolineaceae bacterium]